jgi:hypothetical protein
LQRKSGSYVLSEFEIQYLSGGEDEDYKFVTIAKGVNIPMKEEVDGDKLYGIVESADIGNKLTKFEWLVSYYNPDKTLTDDSYVVSYELTGRSRIWVQFWWPD